MRNREREIRRSEKRKRDDGSVLGDASVTFYGDDGYATRFDDPSELRELAEKFEDAADWLEEEQ